MKMGYSPYQLVSRIPSINSTLGVAKKMTGPNFVPFSQKKRRLPKNTSPVPSKKDRLDFLSFCSINIFARTCENVEHFTHKFFRLFEIIT